MITRILEERLNWLQEAGRALESEHLRDEDQVTIRAGGRDYFTASVLGWIQTGRSVEEALTNLEKFVLKEIEIRRDRYVELVGEFAS